MKPYIILIGAYERDNFGDLLYPKIYEKILGSYITIKTSLIGRNLTENGGDCVVSTRDFLTIQKDFLPLAVIHCGGETIPLLKKNAVSMDLPPIPKQYENIGPYCEAEIADKLVSSDNPFGYLFNYRDFMQEKDVFPIAYMSVGGSSLEQKADDSDLLSAVKSKLKYAKFIGVRDRKTWNFLKRRLRIKARFYPDVVSIISRTHYKEVAKAATDPQIRRIIHGNPYILFQVSSTKIDEFKIQELVDILGDIAEKMNKSLIFQPAGLAGGHDSLEKLRMIAKLISENNPKINVIVQEDRDLWKLVAVIANAYCCVGTSLHVRIVATSFARPCVSLSDEKVNSYVESWKIDKQPYNIFPKELPEAIERAIKIDSVTLKQTSDYLADRVEEGLQEMTTKLGLKYSQNIGVTAINKSMQANLFKSLAIETDRLRELAAKEIIEKYTMETELRTIKSSWYWKLIVFLEKTKKAINKINTTLIRMKTIDK
jgi:hypothetical protein